ncbi:MAG: NFACT RNA binding domain-containing protein [Alicyclobacillus sp.]|nr:NFACT RNA binding domain-containing protein [Alicyclobacillus sp.]
MIPTVAAAPAAPAIPAGPAVPAAPADPPSPSDELADRLLRTLRRLAEDALAGKEPATIGLDELGRPVAAAPFRLTCQRHREAPSFNHALDWVHAASVTLAHESALARELTRAVGDHIDRLTGKLAKLAQMERDSAEHERLRISGELLVTYASQIPKGQTLVELPNYYDDNRPLAIELDPALSAIENAQRYFKWSSKRKRSIPILAAERAEAERDLRYLEDVLVHLQDASAERLEAIREELAQQGFLRKSGRQKDGRQAGRSKERAGRPADRIRPDEFLSADGFIIRVGRSNLQNDRLTLRSSQPTDIWLHVKDQPGAHVVIQADRRDVPDSTLAEAALLAAYFSKARDSANVAVDYTLVKHVWKPGGARPGQVLYDHHKTLFVTPDRDKVEEILRRTREDASAR